jgi:hypothetical protein
MFTQQVDINKFTDLVNIKKSKFVKILINTIITKIYRAIDVYRLLLLLISRSK